MPECSPDAIRLDAVASLLTRADWRGLGSRIFEKDRAGIRKVE